jgi:nucleotide-binding universal stress UspA family protein
MSEQDEELTIRRILIALDTSPHSVAALRAAARLASALDAELHGLFVEDVNLLRAAGLPMARELQFPFATHARMNPERMRRQLRAQALQARRALESICRQEDIEWTFQVVRGGVPSKVLEEAASADLLCLGKIGRPVMRRPGLGSTARAAATGARRSVLLISHGKQIGPPVVVAYDGSPEAEQALLLASRLVQNLGSYLSILVPPDVSRSSKEIQDEIGQRLGGQKLVIRYRELIGSGVMSLIAAVQTETCGILVLSKAILPADDVGKLLAASDCPVLLVA